MARSGIQVAQLRCLAVRSLSHLEIPHLGSRLRGAFVPRDPLTRAGPSPRHSAGAQRVPTASCSRQLMAVNNGSTQELTAPSAPPHPPCPRPCQLLPLLRPSPLPVLHPPLLSFLLLLPGLLPASPLAGSWGPGVVRGAEHTFLWPCAGRRARLGAGPRRGRGMTQGKGPGGAWSWPRTRCHKPPGATRGH